MAARDWGDGRNPLRGLFFGGRGGELSWIDEEGSRNSGWGPGGAAGGLFGGELFDAWFDGEPVVFEGEDGRGRQELGYSDQSRCGRRSRRWLR